MNNNLIKIPGEENLQHGSVDPPPWDGSFYTLCFSHMLLSHNMQKTRKKVGTQVGVQMLWDDNDHGE